MDRARAGQGWQSNSSHDSIAGFAGQSGQDAKMRVTRVGGPFYILASIKFSSVGWIRIMLYRLL